jgi:hypothetical protein
LNAALTYSDGTQGGRPPFDPVMMFKILVIQTTNNLSDERAEFLINDRLSFMRFLGFGLSDRVPDALIEPLSSNCIQEPQLSQGELSCTGWSPHGRPRCRARAAVFRDKIGSLERQQ